MHGDRLLTLISGFHESVSGGDYVGKQILCIEEVVEDQIEYVASRYGPQVLAGPRVDEQS